MSDVREVMEMQALREKLEDMRDQRDRLAAELRQALERLSKLRESIDPYCSPEDFDRLMHSVDNLRAARARLKDLS